MMTFNEVTKYKMDTAMKKTTLFLVFYVLFTLQAEASRGRQPCSGSKGGIAHCTADGRFVCNDGSMSQSKRFCSGYGNSETHQHRKTSTTVRKAQPVKAKTPKKQERQRVTERDEQIHLQPQLPTCAPLYMANKPGFTHLPICSGNQY